MKCLSPALLELLSLHCLFSLSRCSALWKYYILLGGGALTKLLNLNCLAQVSDGFTQGHIVDVVHAVLTELRLLQMARKPLRTAEFVTSLARHDPVYRDEEEAFQVTSFLIPCHAQPHLM